MTELKTPWIVGPLKGKYYGTTILDAEGGDIVTVWLHDGGPSVREIEKYGPCVDELDRNDYFCDSHHETVADLNAAQIIAAAPDMLEALKGVIAVADRKTDEFDRARAAIAKATGTTC